MAKYFPEPAPFALTEREQEFMDYITRELNRVSQTLLDQADISLDEKFIAPDRPQIGQIVFADGVTWDPGSGPGFYGYDGTNWDILGGPTVSGTFVHTAGDVMSGDLEINKASTAIAGYTLVNNNLAASFLISSDAYILFDSTKNLYIGKDTKANLDAHTYANVNFLLLSNTGDLSLLQGGLFTKASTAGKAGLNIPHGVAPNIPVNGDIWTTSSALFARLNGATRTFPTLEGNNTYSNDFNIFSSNNVGNPQIYVMNNTNDAGSGYYIFRKSRAGLAVQVNDILGRIDWQATDSANAAVDASAVLYAQVTALGTGVVDAQILFQTAQAGVRAQRALIKSGLFVGSSGSDMGAGTINAQNGYYLGGTQIPFTKVFESAQQTITAAGSLTLAHGLGVKPKLYQAYIVCQTAEGGYSIGDEVIVDPGWTADASIGRGLSIVPDATNLNIRFGNNSQNFILVNKTTGANFNITNANWKLVIRAWA